MIGFFVAFLIVYLLLRSWRLIAIVALGAYVLAG
jgi:uncharacterized membrane protein